MFDFSFKVVALLGFSALVGASNCYPPLYNYEAGHIPQPDDNLKECRVLSHYSPQLSCCPLDSTCLDNGLCFTPSNNSLEILQYAGCTYLSRRGEAYPGAQYCTNRSVPDEPYQRGSWMVMPCPSGKCCFSFGKASNECCANEEVIFEVSWGAIPDHKTSIYSTWTYTTTQTTTETDCPAVPTTIASTTPADSVARPTVKARFTA